MIADDHSLVVLSIDGVPHGLLGRLMDEGHMPALARLCEDHGRPRKMRSVLPTVSCVAWTCYATGRNPGKHGIFGFVDRRSGSYELTFPNAAGMRGPNLWELLSARGKRVFGMNVPGTYPPRPVNGVLIGGFLAPSLAKAAYPAEVAGYLAGINYRIDSEAALARQSKQAMLADLDATLDRRAEAMFHFLQQDRWDFFHTHIMGTDRINHFLLAQAEQGHPTFAPAFRDYYSRIDGVIARLLEAIGPDAPLMILSDHGFCPITYEVELSRHLVQTGWTAPAAQVAGPLSIDPARSRAFCLIPGRIYINVRGREAAGCVAPEEYERTRDEVTRNLMALRDPQGRPVIHRVLKREEIYWPPGRHGPDTSAASPVGLPPFAMGPDLIAVPHDGYDLKMGLAADEVFVNTQLEGMHTYADAFVVARGVRLPAGDIEIRQLAGPILQALSVPAPEEMDLAAVPPPVGVA
jgi:predicted AlkP superfamily phosphohydrolase/phosphomutase